MKVNGGPSATYAPDHVARLGRLAGLFLMAGWTTVLATLPLFDPPAPARATWVAGAAFLVAVGCACAPWRRLGVGWLHAILGAAGIQIALAMWASGPEGAVYWRFYVVTAAFVAYAFRSRAAIAAHVTLQASLLVAFGALGPQADPLSATEALVSVPVLFMIAILVAHLRERLEERESRLRMLAARDPLTGVGNYRMLEERLQGLVRDRRQSAGMFALFVLDIDRFKEVNDTHGHVRGDEVLRDVGAALEAAVRAGDTVVRQGGDEFAVLAPRAGAIEAKALAGRIADAVTTVRVDGRPLHASVGYAIYPRDARDAPALRTAADRAQLAAKAAARGDAAVPVRPRDVAPA